MTLEISMRQILLLPSEVKVVVDPFPEEESWFRINSMCNETVFSDADYFYPFFFISLHEAKCTCTLLSRHLSDWSQFCSCVITVRIVGPTVFPTNDFI